MTALMETAADSLLDQALAYYDLGWNIIPVPYRTKAATVHWGAFQTERPSISLLEEWFARRTSNMAVIVGEVSGGLTCLDFDRMDLYENWAANYPDWASKLPSVRTARGMHIYFRSDLDKTSKFDGMDLKASGYVMLPPSVHPDGTVYTWATPLAACAEIPFLEVDQINGFIQEGQVGQEGQDGQEAHAINIVGEGAEVQQRIDAAIQATLPTQGGERNRCIFEFCRKLQGIEAVKHAPHEQLNSIVRQWHQAALPYIDTKEFTHTWADFTYAWDKVKYPEGEEFARALVRAARDKGVPPQQMRYDCEKTRLLVRLCYQLQQLGNENNSFFLSYDRAGEVLEYSHTWAGKLLNMLVTDGVLEIVKQPTKGTSAGKRLATEYRFKMEEK